jgi:manganese transport protein
VVPTYVQVLAWLCASIIILLNIKMVADQVGEWLNAPGDHSVIIFVVMPLILLCLVMLLFITVMPIFSKKLTHGAAPLPHGTFKELESVQVETFKRVAITIDFSDVDEKVIRHALSMGGKQAHYLLLHVTETAGAIFLGQDTLDLESRLDTENMLRYMENVSSLEYTCNIKLGYGSPRKILPQMIKEFNSDLVVMGAHGHKGFKDFILGSTIDAVRHNVEIPVLVVR